MEDTALLAALQEQVREAAAARQGLEAILLAICEQLRSTRTGYDWVGFYLADSRQQELVLGPFSGAPTDHTRIPFGRGICGQVAQSHSTMVVADVRGATNYLSCSLDVKSEIVVPIMVEGRFVAQLDIDSHQRDRFGPSDRALLEAVATLLAPFFA